jgi:multidrug efflux pump subunit AcrA (membrane-fusion protein)
MYVPVKVITENRQNVITLPMDAVISEASEKYVYIIADGVAKKSVVSLGIRSGDVYEITDGVRDGDDVVLSGSSLLSDGTKVRIVN